MTPAGTGDGTGPGAAPEGGRPVMHIGEVAARTELSLRSLRHWDEVGLVRPSGRTEGGFRLYTESDVSRILFIRRMKPLGFTLEQMAEVMTDLARLDDPEASAKDRAAARDRLAGIGEQARERRTQLARQLDMADEFLGLLSQRL